MTYHGKGVYADNPGEEEEEEEEEEDDGHETRDPVLPVTPPPAPSCGTLFGLFYFLRYALRYRGY